MRLEALPVDCLAAVSRWLTPLGVSVGARSCRGLRTDLLSVADPAQAWHRSRVARSAFEAWSPPRWAPTRRRPYGGPTRRRLHRLEDPLPICW